MTKRKKVAAKESKHLESALSDVETGFATSLVSGEFKDQPESTFNQTIGCEEEIGLEAKEQDGQSSAKKPSKKERHISNVDACSNAKAGDSFGVVARCCFPKVF